MKLNQVKKSLKCRIKGERAKEAMCKLLLSYHGCHKPTNQCYIQQDQEAKEKTVLFRKKG